MLNKIEKNDLKKPLNRETAIFFANELRNARLAALADAQAFDKVIQAVERLGSYITGKQKSLGVYCEALVCLSEKSSLAEEIPKRFRDLLTPFNELYESVRIARNDALHQGAFARHLTNHTINLAIVLEDALSHCMEAQVSDFMVRNPVWAELWQPVAFVRQLMLANSYSYMPVLEADEKLTEGNEWSIISDVAIANYLGPARNGETRRNRLVKTLADARTDDLKVQKPVKTFEEKTTLKEALDHLEKEEAKVLLVRGPNRGSLLGILTAFDLL